MLDAFKQPISIGDYVVCSGKYSVQPRVSVVKEFTTKKVRLQNGTLKDPRDIIVFTKQHEYALATWPEQYI